MKGRYNTNNTVVDDAASGFRIRNQVSQTPRINLLKMSRKAVADGGDITKLHPLFSQQAQLPKSKPFNYLNPNAKIGVQ